MFFTSEKLKKILYNNSPLPYFPLFPIALTGIPATTPSSGTDLFTNEQAPTIAFRPTTVPSSLRAIIEAFIPIYATCFIRMRLCHCFLP